MRRFGVKNLSVSLFGLLLDFWRTARSQANESNQEDIPDGSYVVLFCSFGFVMVFWQGIIIRQPIKERIHRRFWVEASIVSLHSFRFGSVFADLVHFYS